MTYKKYIRKRLGISIVIGVIASCTSPVVSMSDMDTRIEILDSMVRVGGEENIADMNMNQELADEGMMEPIDQEVAGQEIIDMMVTDPPIDPCLSVDCGPHGSCTSQGDQASCACDARYVAQGLNCVAEDLDNDGADFTIDCNDNDPLIYPQAQEICDQVDQDCDQVIDEGACSIWVLPPLQNHWDAYGLDVSGGVNTPRSVIKAAWDIEELDIAFVLTPDGYHELRLSTLTWSPLRPLSDLSIPQNGPLQNAAFAMSNPAGHTNNPYETVTINLVDGGGSKKVWILKYLISSGLYEPAYPDRFIGEPHIWREEHSDEYSPNPAFVRASWLDIENTRYILDFNPQAFCGQGPTSSNIHMGLLTSENIHMIEAGSCFDFIPPVALEGSPLDLPGAPNFSEVGGAFWHQGSLYLFRGD